MIQIIQLRNISSTRWKNGGGETREIYKLLNKNMELFFRISVANIESDGPFSVYPNINRTLCLLQGNGIDLTFNHAQSFILKHALEFISFPGTDTIDCKLINGPVQDFNIMIDPMYGDFDVKAYDLNTRDKKMNLSLSQKTFLFIAEGKIRLNQDIISEKSMIIFENENQLDYSIIENTKLIQINLFLRDISIA